MARRSRAWQAASNSMAITRLALSMICRALRAAIVPMDT